MDNEWALQQLNDFVELTALYTPAQGGGVVVIGDTRVPQGDHLAITAQAQVVEQILDRVIPNWRTSVENPDSKRKRWQHHRQAAIRAVAQLEREAELAEKLGENAPTLHAAQMHSWVWNGARSLWWSGHRAEAIRAAAVQVNAELQTKVGRRDVSEGDLLAQCYSSEAPQPGKPRLRPLGDDGGKTAKSRRVGAINLGQGLFAIIRNPLSHDPSGELDEQVAVEQLAAWSVLARFIDTSTIVEAEV